MKEKILKFGHDKSLLGLLTQPGRDMGASSIGVVLLNAGIVHRIGPHRLNVKLARRLARLGAPALRFDQSGLGDSPPSRAAVGYEQQAVNDVSAAIDAIVAETASTSVVLVGMCSGADNAYKTALADERVTGIVLLDPYAYSSREAQFDIALRKLFSLEKMKSRFTRIMSSEKTTSAADAERLSTSPAPEDDNNERVAPPLHAFGRDLQILSDRNVSILMLYTNYVSDLLTRKRHFDHAFAGFGFVQKVDVDVDPSINHTYTELSAQEKLFERVLSWIEERSRSEPALDRPDDREGADAIPKTAPLRVRKYRQASGV